MIATTNAARTRAHRLALLLLATLLVVNPVVLFLLTGKVLVAFAITLGCVLAMVFVVGRLGWALPSVYLFNAMAVISVFVHAEVVFVYGFPDYVVENLYTIEDGYYFNRPFLDKTFTTKEYSVRYLTNAQGFRIGEGQDPAHTYSTADWLVIGDSFTQGAQVPFGELYTTLLNRHFPDKIVANAGISGLGIGHEYNYYMKAGSRLRPDLVILQLCSFNDFMNVEPTLVGFTDRLMTYSAFLRFLLADFKFTNPAALPLGRWTEPFHPDQQSNADFNVFYNQLSPTKTRDLAAVERYLTKFRDAVASNGSRLLVVLIPTKEQVKPRYLEEVVREFRLDPSRLNMRRPNEYMAELALRLQIDVVDLLPAFQAVRENPFFEYDEHLSPLGHRLMADALQDRLEAIAGRPKVRMLSADFRGDRYPMLSQDGSLLTYQSFRDRNMELFVASADLREHQQLTVNDIDESHPMLSQDTSQILFTQGSPESHRTEVVLMDLDGSRRRVLTAEPHVFGAIPTFSRSNLQIAYAEWADDPDRRTLSLPRIVVLDTISGNKRYLTQLDRESWRPVFAPDGSRVFDISKVRGQFDLFEYELATGVERQVTNTPFDEWDPQVSPDGKLVVHASRRDDNWDLFVTELATGSTRRLTDTKGDEWDPSFSPDGATVLFAGQFGLAQAMFEMPFPQ